jgi:hypothetical protein
MLLVKIISISTRLQRQKVPQKYRQSSQHLFHYVKLLFSFPSKNITKPTHHLLQLQSLKLPNSLLKRIPLNLQIPQLILLHSLQLLADLLLIPLIPQYLLLLLNALLRCTELLLRLGDLGVDVDAVFDVEKDGGGGRDGEDYAASGTLGAGGEDCDARDGLAGEGFY